MKKITFLLIALLSVIFTFGQVAPDKYYIQFTDKNNSPYSIDNPQEFLTQRSIDRREKFDIEITEQDLPVNPAYLEGVANTGAEMLYSTKWMNGVTIHTTEQSVLDAINALPYVADLLLLTNRENTIKKELFEDEFANGLQQIEGEKSGNSIGSLDYGFGYNQIVQLNGIALHDDGFMGQGMVIAVLDAGFEAVETQPLFDSLWANNGILGTKDFVFPNGNVYSGHYHGRAVLSCMAAYKEGQLIGTAPKASYWLLRSEDPTGENVIEEYNWVSAAEYADSVGADVINSSLGYIDFDLPQWDHDYEDMNGSTAVVTLGADIAESKGILVVNSAGNSGSNPSFPWIGAPADGFNVFSIGAVDEFGNRAGFSSVGPTSDGRTKPDIMAQGQNSAIADGGSGVTFGSGTSFSSPIMAGMSACLMQAFPDRAPSEVRNAIKQSGNNASSPDNQMGWGIPDFMEAYSVMTTIEIVAGSGDGIANVYPNPFNDDFTISLSIENENVKITMMDLNGRMVFAEDYSVSGTNGRIDVSGKIQDIKPGVYFLGLTAGSSHQVLRLVKY